MLKTFVEDLRAAHDRAREQRWSYAHLGGGTVPLVSPWPRLAEPRLLPDRGPLPFACVPPALRSVAEPDPDPLRVDYTIQHVRGALRKAGLL